MDSRMIWTDSDFENMSWHDCPIHGISFSDNFKLLLDLDYISQWISKGKYFDFRLAPCTLVFENVYNVNLENSSTILTIDTVDRENSRKPQNADYIGRDTEYDWFIDFVQGGMSFTSTGFKQYARRPAAIIRNQKLTLVERGGISFDITQNYL